MGIKLIRKN